jgi:hypothetical protein
MGQHGIHHVHNFTLVLGRVGGWSGFSRHLRRLQRIRRSGGAVRLARAQKLLPKGYTITGESAGQAAIVVRFTTSAATLYTSKTSDIGQLI